MYHFEVWNDYELVFVGSEADCVDLVWSNPFDYWMVSSERVWN